jgi:hypothetical protein
VLRDASYFSDASTTSRSQTDAFGVGRCDCAALFCQILNDEPRESYGDADKVVEARGKDGWGNA